MEISAPGLGREQKEPTPSMKPRQGAFKISVEEIATYAHPKREVVYAFTGK